MKVLRFYAPGDVRVEDAPVPSTWSRCHWPANPGSSATAGAAIPPKAAHAVSSTRSPRRIVRHSQSGSFRVNPW